MINTFIILQLDFSSYQDSLEFSNTWGKTEMELQ